MKHWRKNLWINLSMAVLVTWPLLCIYLMWLWLQADPAYVLDFLIFPFIRELGVLGLSVLLTLLLGPPFLAAIILLVMRVRKHRWVLATVICVYYGAIAMWISPKLLALQQPPDGCTRHMKRLTLAMMDYQFDHDSHFPDASRWVDDIYPYVGDWSVFRCPSDRSKGRSSYAMNENLSGKQWLLDDDDYVILLYETTKSGQNPRGIGQDLPIRERHFVRDYGYVNWFGFPDGHIARGSPTLPSHQGHW